MSSILDDPEIERMAATLGMGKVELDRLFGMSLSESETLLREMKSKLPSKFRAAAFKLHPDRNPEDPLAADKFKLLMRVRKILEGIWISSQGCTTPGWEAALDREMEAVVSDIVRPSPNDVRKYGEPEPDPGPSCDEVLRKTFGFSRGVGVSFYTPFPINKH